MRSVACILAGTALLIAPGFDRLGGVLIALGLIGALLGGVNEL